MILRPKRRIIGTGESSRAPSSSVTLRTRAVCPCTRCATPCRRRRRARRRSRCRSARAAGGARAASSTPSGTHTVVSSGRRWPSSREQPEAELLEPVLQQGTALRVARPRLVEPLRRAPPRGRRAERRSSRSARCGGRCGAPPDRRTRAIIRRSRYHDCDRSTKRSRARSDTVSGARPGGTPRHFCVPL